MINVEKAIDDILGESGELPEAYNDDVLNALVAAVESRGLTREDKLALWTTIRNYANSAVGTYMQVGQ